MKKVIALVLMIATLALSMISCDLFGQGGSTTPPEFNPDEKSEGSMTHAEFIAAEMDSEVVIEGYVQGKQSWWNDQACVYLQDGTGGYFVYNMVCTEADYAKLVPGTKIKVTGYKTEYAGLVEVDEGATFEILEGTSWVATATDVTSLLGKDEIFAKQNMFVCFKGMTVKSISYKDNTPGDDIYVTLTKDGVDHSFCVERYLTGPDTDVYKAVQALNEGDVIDVEGFLYWWNGINPHITKVTAAN